ncbi:MAG: RrF2 family transcriptional regulator [Senegalia sp. (in: firmicutes)]|uniref:RrF2 family transcriptional regulator n=1 Tax=Senegalia sp. (in: firmicutes) TaxID=1924098 RepID=UPI003F99F0F4
MKLSTKGRYGLKAMFELALHFGKGPLALKYIAEKQSISEHYLEQLIAILKKDGLVNSVRGAQGGYLLSKDPKDISVGDIIRSLEGSVAPADCVIEGEPVECPKGEYCVTRGVWIKIRDSINDVIDTLTLQNMVDEQKDINGNYMYYI